MILKNTIYICIMSILLLIVTQVRSQTTHIVDNNPNTAADFTDLQNAVNAAADNDTIYVQQSNTNYGFITLNKSLTIIGRSHNDPNYQAEIGDIDLNNGASNSLIRGLKIGLIDDSIGLNNTISNLEFIDCDIDSVSINPSQNQSIINILIRGNIIRFNFNVSQTTNSIVKNNIFFNDGASNIAFDSDTVFSNNILIGINPTGYTFSIGNGLNIVDNCIFLIESSSTETITFDDTTQKILEIRNSITYNYGSGDFNFEMSNNITLINNQENVDPLFTFLEGSSGSLLGNGDFEPELDDLTLQPGSPVVDDGLYEGYDFKPLGTTNGLPSVKIDAYDATVPVNGNLNVTITTKAN